MRGAARASSVRRIGEARSGRWSRFGILVIVLSDFRRAVAAAQRYEDMRYRSACPGRAAPTDIPRQVFEEFYSHGRPVAWRITPPLPRPGQSAAQPPSAVCSIPPRSI
jgi:hypothetical protein